MAALKLHAALPGSSGALLHAALKAALDCA